MVVLGIDPGTLRCGYGIVARAGGRLSRVASGVIVPREAAMAERLAHVLGALTHLLGRGGIDAVAIETAFCGASPRSALAIGQARGVALAAAAQAGLPVHEFAPAEVKRAFTGNGRAEKVQMVRTARALFGVAPRLADEADALAIAVCCLARHARADGRAGEPRAGPSGARATLAASGAPRGTAARLRPAIRRFAGA